MFIVTKLEMMVTNLDGTPLIMLLYPLVLWSWKMMWQTKIIISPIPQCLWPPNLEGWWLIFTGLYPYCYYTIWGHDLPRSCDKVKALNIHSYNDSYHSHNKRKDTLEIRAESIMFSSKVTKTLLTQSTQSSRKYKSKVLRNHRKV